MSTTLSQFPSVSRPREHRAARRSTTQGLTLLQVQSLEGWILAAVQARVQHEGSSGPPGSQPHRCYELVPVTHSSVGRKRNGQWLKGQRHVTCSYITVPQYQSKPGTSPATQTLAHGRGIEWGTVRVMRARARRGCWHVANSLRYQVLPPLPASCNSLPCLLNIAQRRAHASPHTDRLRSRSCTPARRGCLVMVSAGRRGTHHPRGLSLPAARALQSGI